jgi:hypothetical protein
MNTNTTKVCANKAYLLRTLTRTADRAVVTTMGTAKVNGLLLRCVCACMCVYVCVYVYSVYRVLYIYTHKHMHTGTYIHTCAHLVREYFQVQTTACISVAISLPTKARGVCKEEKRNARHKLACVQALVVHGK